MKIYILNNGVLFLSVIFIFNFVLRLLIYSKTSLFNFADFKVYLGAVDTIHREGSIPLMKGNFLFGISYIGYFAKYILGSINWFFVLNCLLGTGATFLIVLLSFRVTGSFATALLTAFFLTFYTEFMVFSSVFYSTVIMLFLLALFIHLLYLYYKTGSNTVIIISVFSLISVLIVSFLFKPELVFYSLFLGFFSVIFIKKDKIFFLKGLFLSVSLISASLIFNSSGILKTPKDVPVVNDFIFFGHTNYGGEGGEGAFIYPENKARYDTALTEYCKANNIAVPNTTDHNKFQWQEIKKYITQHPIEWIGLQFTKFFRTFGVVPETTSFKILYTGLFKGNLWLTSFVVVAPVALIILLFISFFNFSAIKQLLNSSTFQRFNFSTLQPDPAPGTQHPAPSNRYFLYIYLLLFIYYIIATIFFGQYQERYRMPLMVVFIIPILGFFIASFNKDQFFRKSSLVIKGFVIVLFLAIWSFQAKKAIGNKQRLENAIESVESRVNR